MRSLHTIEERMYSPAIKLSGDEYKVLLYIRHNSIRWEQELIEMSFTDISRATGVHKSNVKRVVNRLHSDGLIVVVQQKRGNAFLQNKYGLNDKFFGELIETTCRPKLSVIEGGKTEKLSTGGSQMATTPVANQLPPWEPNSYHPQGQEPLPAQLSSSLKNPSKEPFKKLLGEKGDNFSFFESGSEGKVEPTISFPDLVAKAKEHLPKEQKDPILQMKWMTETNGGSTQSWQEWMRAQ